MAARKIDRKNTILGHLVLNVTPGLSGNARQVGGALLTYFNRQSGRCDPSQGSLATRTQLSLASVKRAIVELCSDDVRLFRKVSHGGLNHRSSYEPLWDEFELRLSSWNANSGEIEPSNGGANSSGLSCSGGASNSSDLSCSEDLNSSNLSPLTAQTRAVEQLRSEPQTYLVNLSRKPTAPSGASGDARSDDQMTDDKQETQSQPKGLNELWKGNAEKPHRLNNSPSKVVVSLSRSEIADDHAVDRLEKDMRALGTDLYVRILDAMTAELLAEATAAERQKRGQGIWLVQSRLAKELCHG